MSTPHIVLPSWSYSEENQNEWDLVDTDLPNSCGLDRQSPVNLDLEEIVIDDFAHNLGAGIGQGDSARGPDPPRGSEGWGAADVLSSAPHPLTQQLQQLSRVTITNTGHDLVVTPDEVEYAAGDGEGVPLLVNLLSGHPLPHGKAMQL
jgi:hypothetical protein